ncbi:MAG: hypothetical protein Q8K86_01865 [Candidatus Nanopelagicaceae bacterium]|nr:hypothetical protein [Candidatus Nanopelagicaceae bacterium]
MTQMVLVWLVAPIFLLILSFGVGLLLIFFIRRPINFVVATALGFLVIAILGSLLTISTLIAPHTALIIGILSLTGLILGYARLRQLIHFDLASMWAGVLTYLAFGLPVIASGNPTWAGWVKLDDPGTFLAITDRLMSVGRTTPELVTSTYSRVIQTIFDPVGAGHFSYPVGSFMPFGVTAKLTRVESAWFFQPYMSISAALVAMLFVLILRSYMTKKFLLVLIATAAAIASTIYSYVMWGAIKEIVILIPIVLFAITIFESHKNPKRKDNYLFAFVTATGMYFIGGAAGFGFILPTLFVAVLLRLFSRNRILAYATVGGLAAALVVVTYFLRAGNNAIANILIPIIGDAGNLSRALKLTQIAGIWPAQDFRMDPMHPLLTSLMIITATVFVLAGVYFSIKGSLWIVPSLLIATLAVVANSFFWGGIWLTGKAIAVASPIFLLCAGIGAVELWRFAHNHRRPTWGKLKLHYLVSVLAVIIGSGVFISDFLTYKNVWLAPFSQVDELRKIGHQFAGEGPTLMTEYSVFGSRYFLRDMDAEAVSELRVHVIPTRDGNQVPKGFAADIDLFDHSTIDYFKILVLRKSPTASRPPLNYELAQSGQHYEVWRQVDRNVLIKSTLPLGNNFYPAITPTCDQVSMYLSTMVEGDKVFAAYRNRDYVVNFADGDLPPTWYPTNPFTGGVDRVGSGGFSRSFTVDDTDKYDLSIAGSFPGLLKILVDGVEVFSGRSIVEQNSFLTNTLASVELAAGRHTLTVLYDKPALLPGGDVDSRFGPIYLSTQDAGDVKVTQVPASRLDQLCTRNVDWIAIAH